MVHTTTTQHYCDVTVRSFKPTTKDIVKTLGLTKLSRALKYKILEYSQGQYLLSSSPEMYFF